VNRNDRKDVLNYEAKVLKTLDYQLAHYTVEHYINLFQWERGEEQRNENISLLADLSLFDCHTRQLKRSELAEAIISSVKKNPD